MKTKHRKWILMILMVCMAFILSGCASSKYKEAQELFAAQNYAEAQKIFTEIEDHEDSGKYLAYIAAVKEADAGRFAQASEAFAALSGFQDSDKLSIYYAARQAETEERYEDADALYQQLGTFMDSATRKNSLPELIVNRDERNRAKLYAQGQTALSNGDYEAAIAAFAELNTYEESSKYLMYARAMKMAEEGQYELAISSFASLKDFSDSDLQVTYYTARQAEAEQRYEDAEPIYKSIATFRDSMDHMNKLPDMILDRDFALFRSVIMSEEKVWDANFDPYYLFTAVYSDSETRMLDQLDQLGDDALAAGLYWEAVDIFGRLYEMGYAGAYARILDCIFALAQNEMKMGNYSGAIDMLEILHGEEYAGAEETLKECYYHLGLDAEAKENYASAHKYYTLAVPHGDSAEKAARFENEYAAAEVLLSEGKFDEAVTAFTALKNYKDAEERIPDIYYNQGEALLAAGEWDAASAAFTNAGTYSDASTRILETYYKQGEALLAAENEAGAIAAFKKAEPFSNAKERWQMIYYAQAERHLAAGEWDEASAAFTNAGTYSDASTRILEPYYKQGEALLAAGDEAGAIEAFKKAEPFSNAKERWQEIVQDKITPTPIPSSTPSPTSSGDIEVHSTSLPHTKSSVLPTWAPAVTAAPTQAPTPTPMPRLNAEGDISFKLNDTVFIGSKAQEDFQREEGYVAPNPDEYGMLTSAGVLTFRGDNFRRNAAYGTAEIKENSMSILWQSPIGSLRTEDNGTLWGVGWTGQPAIIKWSLQVREMMNLYEEKKDIKALREVIFAAQDGKIYFLDLATGEATRDPINVGFPLKGSVAVDSTGLPMLAVGQSISKLANGKTGDIGLHVFNLIDGKHFFMINGRQNNAQKQYFTNGAFDSTPLFLRKNDAMIIAGENGLLYTVDLNPDFKYPNANAPDQEGSLEIDQEITYLRTKASEEKDAQVPVESSVAMYDKYIYMADTYGVLRCVDSNTMTTVWAMDNGDNTDAAIALDMEGETGVSLYTGNTAYSRLGSKKDVSIRKLDALTGEELWCYNIKCDYNKYQLSGVKASPVVGQHDIADLVIFTVNMVKGGGSRTIALNKANGKVIWHHDMSANSISSPVAVYNSKGRAWIIQADGEGTLYMLDGRTGRTLSTLNLGGKIESSPAVYKDILVIGTCSEKAQMYAIKLQ